MRGYKECGRWLVFTSILLRFWAHVDNFYTWFSVGEEIFKTPSE